MQPWTLPFGGAVGGDGIGGGDGLGRAATGGLRLENAGGWLMSVNFEDGSADRPRAVRLLPCWDCLGRYVRYQRVSPGGRWIVICMGCGLGTIPYWSHRLARRGWNRAAKWESFVKARWVVAAD